MTKPQHRRQKLMKTTTMKPGRAKPPKSIRITFMVTSGPIEEIHDHPKVPPDAIDAIIKTMAPAEQFIRTPVYVFMKEHEKAAADLAKYWVHGYEPWKDPNTGIYIIAPPRLS